MFSLLTLPLMTSLLSPPINSRTPPKSSHLNWPSIKHLITFGDSYTYIQGTPYGRQNCSFIGDLQNLAFTPTQLLESKIVQNQISTAEGGANWVEFLTGCGVKPGLTNPRSCKRELWDFAFAGADVSEEILPLHHDYTVSFVKQIEQFMRFGERALQGVVERERALVVVWIGINDINDSKDLDVDFKAFYEKLITTMLDAVRGVRDLGYGKFLFMNLPPLDRTPGNIDANDTQKARIDLYDSTLSNAVALFSNERDSTWAQVFDANTFLNGVMNRHEYYGIKDITDYCPAYDQPDIGTGPGKYGCLPLEQYFWFNLGHLTSRVHEILANEVERFLEGC